MNRVLINDLSRQSATVAIEIRRAIERVVESGWYVLGSECTSFEREFAEFCSVKYCVGVANGTDALELAFRALGIGRGTRVATVANAGFYSSAAIAQVGAESVFVDVEPDTGLMDLNALAFLAQTKKIDAVVITHLFGLMHDMQSAREIADRAAILMVEDCAQAHGARRDGLMAGSVGHAGCFSFYPTKNLGALGDGGAVVTNARDVAARLTQLRQYGWEGKYKVKLKGGRNSRLDEIQAAVLRAKLPYLRVWNARRREIAFRYTQRIAHPRVTCPLVRGEEDVAHLYVIRCDDRDALRTYLLESGIACDVHYPIPDHLQLLWENGYQAPVLPVTERLALEGLTLPCYPELTDDETDWIIQQINAW